jgi:hypothetical protein
LIAAKLHARAMSAGRIGHAGTPDYLKRYFSGWLFLEQEAQTTAARRRNRHTPFTRLQEAT